MIVLLHSTTCGFCLCNRAMLENYNEKEEPSTSTAQLTSVGCCSAVAHDVLWRRADEDLWDPTSFVLLQLPVKQPCKLYVHKYTNPPSKIWKRITRGCRSQWRPWKYWMPDHQLKVGWRARRWLFFDCLNGGLTVRHLYFQERKKTS